MNGYVQGCIQNPVRHLRWSVLRKYLTAKSLWFKYDELTMREIQVVPQLVTNNINWSSDKTEQPL